MGALSWREYIYWTPQCTWCESLSLPHHPHPRSLERELQRRNSMHLSVPTTMLSSGTPSFIPNRTRTEARRRRQYTMARCAGHIIHHPAEPFGHPAPPARQLNHISRAHPHTSHPSHFCRDCYGNTPPMPAYPSPMYLPPTLTPPFPLVAIPLGGIRPHSHHVLSCSQSRSRRR
jgi:hypothetical protein